MAFSDASITFGPTGLQGVNVNNPTALDFSKAGHAVLFVAQQNGEIWRIEVERQADGPDGDTLPQFVATAAAKISDIKLATQNYNDNGTVNATTERQMTGLVTATDAEGRDVLYVSSSDWRIAVGTDSGLDTNSGQIHKLVLDHDTGAVISNVAILRGLPRSEENHSTNGLDISIDPDTGHRILWIAQGGNSNSGAPGNNFAGTVDFAYSGAILKIDLDVVESYDVRVDGKGDPFILDLPTLDHPGRANVDLSTLGIANLADAPNFTLDDNGTGSNGQLNPDWAGGDNGLNQAKIAAKVLVSDDGQLKIVDNPLTVHSPGFRNPFDVLVTEKGEVFTWDNGPNGGWGGRPIPFVDNTPGSADNWVENWRTELATNRFNESGSEGSADQLHYLGNATDPYGPYAGFTGASRAAKEVLEAAFNPDGSYRPGTGNPVLDQDGATVIFPDEATARTYLASLLIVYEEQGDGNWVDVTGTTGLPADLFDIVAGYGWTEPGSSFTSPKDFFKGPSVMDGTYFSPESQRFFPGGDGSLKFTGPSTNGIAEYTATFFDNKLQGAIIAASFNGALRFDKPIDTDGDGRTDAVTTLGNISDFGTTPLGVTALGDDGIFGTLIDSDGDGIDDFAGIIVAGTYGSDSITFFVPGGVAADPSTDLDLDGIDNVRDSHVGDPLEGKGVIVGADQTAFWGFELNNPATTPPGAVPSGESIVGDIGINAVWRNNVDPQVAPAGDPALYNPDLWNLGGASSFASLDVADDGAAEGTADDQRDVLGIGFAAPNNIGGVTITTEMVNAFSYTLNTDAAKTWTGGEKFGLMVGPGNQDTFVEATIAVVNEGGVVKYGVQLLVEQNDVFTTSFIEIPGIETPIRGLGDPNVQLAIELDMGPGAQTATAQARYVTDGAFTDWVETAALELPAAVSDAVRGQYNNLGKLTGAVVGLLASTTSGDDSFGASWDWVQVDGIGSSVADGEVLYRWNGGNATVAAIDGGLDWTADFGALVGGPALTTQSNTVGLDASVPATTPTELFKQERFDKPDAFPMALEFGNGLLPDGNYAVRLFMKNSDAGTSMPGQRVFDVSIEDQLFLDNIDLSVTFGHRIGGMFEWVGQVSDGTIDIDFASVIGNPLINGIEIIKVADPVSGPVISALDATVNEAAGTVSVTIQSNVAVPLDSTVTVNFEIAGGTATQQYDYDAPGLTFDPSSGNYLGTAQIAGGSADLTVPITIVNDAAFEGNETFQLHVTSVTGAGATIGNGTATVTIVDDDAAPPVLPADSVKGSSVGDFSDNAAAPTAVNLVEGDNVIVATQAGDPNRDYDYIKIVVPQGKFLTSIVLDAYDDYDTAQVNATFLGMQAGASFTEPPGNPNPANLLGGVVFDELDLGKNLLADMADGVVEGQGANTMGFSTPLGAGSYTLWFSQNGDAATSTIRATVAPPPPTTGAAVFDVTRDKPNVQVSNFAANSFGITNTGDKNIVHVEIDVTNALYPDTVFDPFGVAGDTTFKALTIDTAGGTGVVAPSADSYIGSGGVEGFEKIVLDFDANVSGGFQPGEKLGFSIDMDPNSVAGASKGPLDAGTSPHWDVGGVSGAELIGSKVTVTFEDGTTATGQLHGAGNQGGSQALASQTSPGLAVGLTVNGLGAGGVGAYGAGGPSVVVSGPVGETARIVMTKGFIQPVTNNFAEPYKAQLAAQLAALAASDFPANNAVEFQTVDVVLTGANQDISGLFDFSGVANFDFVGEDRLPLGFVAAVVDPGNANLPLGPVTQPVYLGFEQVNLPPQIAPIADLAINEGQMASVTITATDADEVNDAIALSIVVVDGAGAEIPAANYSFIDNGDGTAILNWIAPEVTGNQTFVATVTAGDGVSTSTSTFDIAVADTDTGPMPVISVLDSTAHEADGSVDITFQSDISLPLDATVTVSFEIVPGSAVPGQDYAASDLTFDPGTGVYSGSGVIVGGGALLTVPVDVLNDAAIEGDEGFTVHITGVTGGNAVIGDGTGSVTITDDDAPPVGNEVLYRWNGGNATVAAIDGGLDWTADFGALVGGGPALTTQSSTAGLDASVPAATTPVGLFKQERFDKPDAFPMALEFGAGGLADGLYAVRLFMKNGDGGTSGPGQRLFDVSIEDQLFLDDVDLSATFGHRIGGMFEWTGEVSDGTIDIDFASVLGNPLINGVEILRLGGSGPGNRAPQIAPIAGIAVDEGQVASTTITASDPDNDPLTLSLVLKDGAGATVPGTAYSFTDHGDGSGAFSWTTPDVPQDRTFTATVTASDGLTATTAAFAVAVADTGVAAPAPVIAALDATAAETAGTLPLLIRSDIAVPAGQTVTVNYQILPGSATPGQDYSAAGLNFDANTGIYSGSGQIAAGATQLSVPVTILNDSLAEGDEAFSLHITGVTGGNAVIGDGTGSVTITDDDAPPVGNEVLYRWNGGNATVAAIDGGLDWTADFGALVGGPAGTSRGNIRTLDASVPTDTTPIGLFAQERFDKADGTPMALEFGDGNLADGTYAVRLFMGNSYGGTSAPGQRLFDVSVEDQLFLDDLDLSASLGHKVGGMFEWVGEVDDGTIDIDFASVLDNPLINGVEILKIGDPGLLV